MAHALQNYLTTKMFLEVSQDLVMNNCTDDVSHCKDMQSLED